MSWLESEEDETTLTFPKNLNLGSSATESNLCSTFYADQSKEIEREMRRVERQVEDQLQIWDDSSLPSKRSIARDGNSFCKIEIHLCFLHSEHLKRSSLENSSRVETNLQLDLLSHLSFNHVTSSAPALFLSSDLRTFTSGWSGATPYLTKPWGVGSLSYMWTCTWASFESAGKEDKTRAAA